MTPRLRDAILTRHPASGAALSPLFLEGNPWPAS